MRERRTRRAGRRLSAWLAAALVLLTAAGCGPDRARVAPPGPTLFENLSYRPARERYRERMEERYRRQDLSYLISVLDYALTSFYARDREAARQAFTAAYRVDDGNIPEAVKFFNWLQEDTRKVYRLDKRERLLAHFYLGLNYLFEDNLEAATVEFKKLRLRDMGASQLPAVNFFYGLVCELSGEYDNALIEYRGLAEMTGGEGFPGAAGLVARAESLASGRVPPAGDSLELIIQVDHLFAGSAGPVEVWADGELVAGLPGRVDLFEVRLTGEEASRKAVQEASAEVTRQALRLLSNALARAMFDDARVGDLAADLTFGSRDDREDSRYWGYAPVAFSFGRVRIPAGTREVRLEFSGPGGRLGSCRYPLGGEHARVDWSGRAVFVVAGLAKEFYEYQ
ncbi:MAG: hypothetical protein R6X14_10270 [bacterium]